MKLKNKQTNEFILKSNLLSSKEHSVTTRKTNIVHSAVINPNPFRFYLRVVFLFFGETEHFVTDFRTGHMDQFRFVHKTPVSPLTCALLFSFYWQVPFFSFGRQRVR